MTLILQESDDISPDLLRPLLDSVWNENKVIWFASYQILLVFFSLCFFYLFGYLPFDVVLFNIVNLV